MNLPPPPWASAESAPRGNSLCQKPPETSKDHHRPPETTKDHQTPLQTPRDHYRPPETTIDPQRPLWTTIDHQRPQRSVQMSASPSDLIPYQTWRISHEFIIRCTLFLFGFWLIWSFLGIRQVWTGQDHWRMKGVFPNPTCPNQGSTLTSQRISHSSY